MTLTWWERNGQIIHHDTSTSFFVLSPRPKARLKKIVPTKFIRTQFPESQKQNTQQEHRDNLLPVCAMQTLCYSLQRVVSRQAVIPFSLLPCAAAGNTPPLPFSPPRNLLSLLLYSSTFLGAAQYAHTTRATDATGGAGGVSRKTPSRVTYNILLCLTDTYEYHHDGPKRQHNPMLLRM